jgi:hypothetical protein
VLLQGPVHVRPPSPPERAAIVRVEALRGCARYAIRISTLDARYGVVRFPGCARLNGFVVVRRAAHGWREINGGSDPFPCNALPPGILLSLFGGCLEQRDPVTPILARSPRTLLYYRAALWWGARGRVQVDLIRRTGAWTVARIRSPTVVQWVLLRRRRIVDAVPVTVRRFFCRAAPPHVLDRLGGCRTSGRSSWDFPIAGPLDRRPATATERRRIPRRCTRVFVSRLDPAYAQAEGCYLSGATALYHHGREVDIEIDGFPCRDAPPGIIRSLHGRCLAG